MKNQSNLTVNQIVASDVKGMGSAAHLAEVYTFQGQVFSMPEQPPIVLSDSTLKALFIRNLYKDYKASSVAAVSKLLTAYENGYLTTVHATIGDSPVNNPLAPVGKVLTADQYSDNYVRAGFNDNNIAAIRRLLARVRAVNDTTTRAELTKMLNDWRGIFETPENYDNSVIIATNEQRHAAKLESLTSLGLTNIERLKHAEKSLFRGRVTLADASNLIQQLPSNGFDVVNSTTDMTALELVVDIELVDDKS